MLTTYAFVGFGYLFFEKQEYQQAARCFYSVVVQRENFVDENSVLLAQPLNNLACCLICLDKKEKAVDYLKISQCVFEMALEHHDEYLLTVKRNIACAISQSIYVQPNYQATWLMYYKNDFTGVGKGGIHQPRRRIVRNS